MKRNTSQALAHWISEGFRLIGEILIRPLGDGGYELRHRADEEVPDLRHFEGSEAARNLSFLTASGEYRPLKTAPSLQRGWRLTLSSPDMLREALDHFYPAMSGVWLSHLEGSLKAVPLRDTLNRQTGMYAATKRLLDGEGQELVGKTCQSQTGCLKRKLWPFDHGMPLTLLSPSECVPDVRSSETHPDFKEIPMLCHEACNLLVAACREVVKTRERAAQSAAPEKQL
jgi:sirohydrochlorin cobaltochelatase